MDQQHDDQHTDATEHWEPDEMMISRPKWPKVIGIISIVLGALGLTCGGIGLALAPMSAKLMETTLEGDPLPYGMQVTGIDFLIGGIGLILSGVLLFAGITGVTRRPVTRPLHLTYAICAIPMNIWGILNQMAKQEQNVQWAKDFPNNPMAQSMDPTNNPGAQIGQMIGLGLFLILGLGIPMLYLIWFGLVKTKPEQITGGDEGVY